MQRIVESKYGALPEPMCSLLWGHSHPRAVSVLELSFQRVRCYSY